MYSADEGGGVAGKFVYVFTVGIIIVCQSYKLTLSDQAQVTVQLRCHVKIFSWPAPFWEASEPALGGPGNFEVHN
jgi:hypothetical protein